MGLTSPALKYILSRSQKYHFKGPLLTFGNQDIYVNFTTLNKWALQYKIKPLKLSSIKTSTSLGLGQINSESSSFVHAESFFELMGILPKDYFDVDKYDFDKPRLLHDLEKPFPLKYKNYFKLIIDSGTIEHIFDIKAVMENIINISKVGGYVLHITPTNNFLNHGFYQINPTFFSDFYTANGFKIIESYLVEFRAGGYRFHSYNHKKFQTFFVNPYSRLCSVFLVQKIKNIDKIISPTQYTYQTQVVTNNKKKSKGIFGKYTDGVRSLLPFKYHSMFYLPWVIYKQLFISKKYFDIFSE